MMDKTMLEAAYKTAKDLHEIGLIDDTTMREFEAVCLPSNQSHAVDDTKSR